MSITTYNRSATRKSFVNNVMNAVERNRVNFIPVNIKETEDNFFVELIVPGYQKDLFSINVENNQLNISYKQDLKKGKEEENEKKYLVNTYSVRDFERTFKISDVIDVKALEAKFNDGVLTITLPKSEEKKAVKIEVK